MAKTEAKSTAPTYEELVAALRAAEKKLAATFVTRSSDERKQAADLLARISATESAA